VNQYPKRLIEVDLPIKRISAHARREKSIRHGHISTLHTWGVRRPLAACHAVICAALWPDPTDDLCPQPFREAATAVISDFAQTAMADKTIDEKASPLAMEAAMPRFTPTCVGKTEKLAINSRFVGGSPPRVWGKQLIACSSFSLPPVHPHVCGENGAKFGK
jgi:hypothetical protein